MNVREVIEKLQAFDPELKVYFEPGWGTCGCCDSGRCPEVEMVDLVLLDSGENVYSLDQPLPSYASEITGQAVYLSTE